MPHTPRTEREDKMAAQEPAAGELSGFFPVFHLVVCPIQYDGLLSKAMHSNSCVYMSVLRPPLYYAEQGRI